MVAAVSFADEIPAGHRGVIRKRGQLPGKKWMAVICGHYYGNSHNTQTHAPLVIMSPT